MELLDCLESEMIILAALAEDINTSKASIENKTSEQQLDKAA
jgi:hypothetical protein